MIKLLILNDLVYSGGVEKIMEEIVCFLPKNEYDVTVATIHKDITSIKKYFPDYIKYISLDKAFKYAKQQSFLSKVVSALKRRIYKYYYRFKLNLNKYDVVIAMKEGECMKALSDVKAKQKFAWVHVDYNYLYWTKYVYNSPEDEVKCMQKFDKVICVSEACKRSICDIIGNPQNLIVKRNPLNVKQIIKNSNEKLEILEGYNIDNNKFIFVTVGGLRESKGFFRLLECCKDLNKKFKYELWIIGDGEERKGMEDYIQKYNLDNVVLWGEQRNPYPFIKKANCFVSSSFGESYGLAVQEAIILNKPVIATTCPAFEECIDSSDGILVENSTEGLYKGMYDILDNPKVLEKYNCKHDKDKHNEFYIQRLEEIESLWKKN